MQNKTLLIILSALILVFVASQFIGKSKNRSFDPNIVSLDGESITKIEIEKVGADKVTVNKRGEEWQVSSGDESYTADQNQVASLINEIQEIIGKKVVSRSPETAKKYSTDNETSSRIILYQDSKKLADLNIGRFSFDQQTRKPISYIKSRDEKETYLVESFISMSAVRELSSLRDKSLTTIANTDDVNSIRVSFPEGEVVYSKAGSIWSDSNSEEVDSIKINNYISGLANFKGTAFSELDFDNEGQLYELKIGLKDGLDILIQAKTSDGENYEYSSSQYPENVFESPKDGNIKSILFDAITLMESNADE